MIFVLIALFIAAPIMSFADLLYPHMEYHYNNVGEGAVRNYSLGTEGELAATIEYEVTLGDTIIGTGTNWMPSGDIVVQPGDELDIHYTIKFAKSYGDGPTGSDSIKDLLFVSMDEADNELGAYPARDSDFGAWFAEIDRQELGDDDDFTLDVQYTVPDSGPGAIRLPYVLFDYGSWRAPSINDAMRNTIIRNVWWYTESVEGNIPLYIPDTVELELNKEIVMLNGDGEEMVDDMETVEFEVTISENEPEVKLLEAKVLTFAGIYDITTDEGESLSMDFVESPDLRYIISETDIPEDFRFLRYEFEYQYGDATEYEQSSELVTDFDMRWMDGVVPDRLIITVVNVYEPVPETTVPETTVPETTIPETTIPETTVPETTVPETTVPETTVPPTEPTFNDEPLTVEETVPVEETPLAAPVVEAPEQIVEPIPPELIPLAPATLPKTGELPATLFYGIGGLISGVGVFMRRK